MRSVSKRIHIDEKRLKKGGSHRHTASQTTPKQQKASSKFSAASYLKPRTASEKRLQGVSKPGSCSSGRSARSNKYMVKKSLKSQVAGSDLKKSVAKQKVTSSRQKGSVVKQKVTSSCRKRSVAKHRVTSSVLKRSVAKARVTQSRSIRKRRVTSSAEKRSTDKIVSSQSVVSAVCGVSLKTASVVLDRSPHLDKYCQLVVEKAKPCQTDKEKRSAIKGRTNKMNLETEQQFAGEAAAESNDVMVDPKSSPKKLKGTLSVKFKSWNLQKEGSHGKESFSDLGQGAGQETLIGEKKVFPKQVVISQDNQMLQKCDSCLLYIPVESFEQHRKKDCEALNIVGGKDYICSECLACYASQKFLARHKRECPKRSQSLAMQSGYQRSWGQGGVEGMYSVVWKCHCKSNFTSAEELGKHRETCISAQQYTATCPICNIRVMGGSRTLRYHMTQNHASLFMPEETSSSSVLGGLEGTSPVGVITTQTANLSDLVRRLSREHAGANIRIVSVNTDRHKGQQKDTAPDRQGMGRGQQGIVIEPDQTAGADQSNSPAERTATAVQEHQVVGVDSNEMHCWQEDRIGTIEEKVDPDIVAMAYNETRAESTDKVLVTEVGDSIGDIECATISEGHHADASNKDDLKNLLVKAKALTKELEEKLATGNGLDKAEKLVPEATVVKRSPRKRKSMIANLENDAATPKKKAVKSPVKSSITVKQEATDQRPVKTKRRFSQVTCLDCQQVFSDYIELGRHKRTDCPVVISQHLSPDGNFTEKVDLFGKDQKAKQQKLDVVECYYCTLCSSKFKLRSQVYEHMRFEHKNKGLNHYLNYHCPYCPRVFQTTKQRHLHKLERHADIKIAPEDDFTVKETEVCSVCYQVVPKWDKDKHFATNCKKNATETESDTFCQLCGLLLDTQEALKQHRQVEHLNAIHFRCGLCSRTFGHAVELRCHKVSHHTKNPRWEQNYTTVKTPESKMSPGTKNIKIHISPCVEEVKSPTAKSRESSPSKTPRDDHKHVTFALQTSEESTNSKGPSAKSKSIRMPTDGSPLSLTPEQMKSLSRGQPIKLVLPKDADMKNLSFTVPGEDGKPKKYSLLPKSLGDIPGQKGRAHNKEELSKLGASLGVQVPVEAEKLGSPQRELAAALGLRPRGNAEPVRTQHRPTRLRSGRTIDKKVGVLSGKKIKKPAAAVSSARAKFGLRPSTRGKKVVVTVGRKKRKKENSSPKKTVKDKELVEKEPRSKKKAEQKTEAAGQRGRMLTRKEAKAENKGSSDKEMEKMVTRPGRMARRASKGDAKGLAPVQVLKPIGKDRVLCMRCNSILGSMEEVACHHCKVAK